MGVSVVCVGSATDPLDFRTRDVEAGCQPGTYREHGNGNCEGQSETDGKTVVLVLVDLAVAGASLQGDGQRHQRTTEDPEITGGSNRRMAVDGTVRVVGGHDCGDADKAESCTAGHAVRRAPSRII